MKICFIGNYGHIIPAYNEMKKCEEAEFVGIATASEYEKKEELKLKEFGIKVFDSYQEMIEETKPDVVVVSSVFGLTGEIIKYCAQRKIDVFAEKPIAKNLTELEEVENAVRQNNIHFSAMFFLRFQPTFYHAQKMVRNGCIGTVKLITAQKSYKYGNRPEWYKNRELYTGTIPWVAIHAIDWIYFFVQKKFLSVNALHEGNPEMTALCQFEMEDDVFASVNVDYLRPLASPSHGDDRIRVAGDKGVIEVFEDRFVLINENGVKEYRPSDAPCLAYDFLLKREELSMDDVFMLTRVSLLARESADKKQTINL